MDIKKLVQLLKEYKVNFVVIGATGGVAHGYSRLTRDIDFFLEPTHENFLNAFQALEKFGYDLQEIPIEEALQKKILFRGYILRTDIHPHVTGIDWETVWKNKVEYTLHGEKVFFASLDDLIQMKKAAGRPKDLEDLRYLEEIKRQLEKKNP